MAVCFVCNSKLYGERTRVCSSITPHSNAPYPEKIGELMGEEFVIIVTPADHMCKRCTSLLIHIDKLENDLKLVKNAMLSYIQKKYGLLPADQPVTSIEVVNGSLRTDELEIGQRRVPSGLTVREPSTSAGGSNTPLRSRQDASKIKIYKCGFCPFQSKDLGHVRFHMRSHMKKKDNEKSNQTVTKTVTQQQQPQQQQHQNQTHQLKCLPNKQQQQKKKLYRCQVCSASFDSRSDCLDHIQRDHNQQPTSTTQEQENLQQESDVTMEETASVFQPHNILNSIENQQDVIKTEDDGDLADDKHTMDTDLDMLLKDNIPDENSEVPPIQETQNISENMSGQTELMQPDQETPVANVDISDMAIGGGETETDHLDIESMLAAIHNDVVSPPNDGGNAQNFL
ncbi:serine/threonine-protein kinase pakD-like [Metopolophium dirhodum]|uniref:serine/threonine-protein kinase pakD-like n=1 Tax=Metopolophium dirhodum TaxID=44670 RepID=UPI00299068A2|nr:serine/threonine-protein kinase pakD-like [Metopolophium dirhodum]